MLFLTPFGLLLQQLNVHGLVWLLFWSIGRFKGAAASWSKLPSNTGVCTIGQDPCCFPVVADEQHTLLDVPFGSFVTAQVTYTYNRLYWNPGKRAVTVKHYHGEGQSMEDYFTMHVERDATYYNKIKWHGDEIDRYGQHLAVCVQPTKSMGGSQTSYTVEVFAEIWI